MYYIVEILSSTRVKFVGWDEDLDRAKKLAYDHSFRTGIEVEVQNEVGKKIDHAIAWRD